jgi:hypothetical protein
MPSDTDSMCTCGAPLSAHWGFGGRQCPQGGLVADFETGEIIANLGPVRWFEEVPDAI